MTYEYSWGVSKGRQFKLCVNSWYCNEPLFAAKTTSVSSHVPI